MVLNMTSSTRTADGIKLLLPSFCVEQNATKTTPFINSSSVKSVFIAVVACLQRRCQATAKACTCQHTARPSHSPKIILFFKIRDVGKMECIVGAKRGIEEHRSLRRLPDLRWERHISETPCIFDTLFCSSIGVRLF